MADPRDIVARLRMCAARITIDSDVGQEATAEELRESLTSTIPRLLEAADEIERMRAEFMKYAQHPIDCAASDYWYEKPTVCSCGLDAARKRAGGG